MRFKQNIFSSFNNINAVTLQMSRGGVNRDAGPGDAGRCALPASESRIDDYHGTRWAGGVRKGEGMG